MFTRQQGTGSLVLKGADVLRTTGSLFICRCHEGYESCRYKWGFEALKKFRFTTKIPIHVSSVCRLDLINLDSLMPQNQ